MAPHWRGRVLSVALGTAALFVTLALLTYSPEDVGLLSSHPRRPPANLAGSVGAWIGLVGRGGFGWASLLVPLCGWLWAWRLWRRHEGGSVHGLSMVGAALCLLASVGTLLALQASGAEARTRLGGIVGLLGTRAGTYYLGTAGTLLTAVSVGVLSWVVVSGQTLSGSALRVVRRLWRAARAQVRRLIGRAEAAGALARAPRIDEPIAAGAPGGPRRAAAAPATDSTPPAVRRGEAGGPPRVRIRAEGAPSARRPARAVRPAHGRGGFQLPPLDLLASPSEKSERELSEDLQANAKVLEATLREFGLAASVVNIDRGPTVTRYELTPAPGVKITRIASLADDLALVLKATSCQVVAPIPGKGRVGIDVPNMSSTIVGLKEILSSREFQERAAALPLAIGKDVSGQPVVADLCECPHLLIAGATGSGKTVCLNSILIGLLAHASPEQVRFLMIDPKMVELAMFNHIPHLVAPVVTQSKRAAAALNWAVGEMERRYELLARAGVRNLEAYNARAAAGTLPPAAPVEGEAAAGEDGQPMPYLVIVIDELADLMMLAAQDVEGAITRLSQLSRAVGIHMILATQRPSVDVITGVIKANFPARIAFQVASRVDSRTILDSMGADKLIGRGDLLFLAPGTAKPVRIQGSFIRDAEIERVTAFLREQAAPDYDGRLLQHQQQPEAMTVGEKDELYETAKQVVVDAGQATTSLLQRRLRLGYGRAARILDLLEQEGVVGPAQGSRPREVLVSRDALEREG